LVFIAERGLAFRNDENVGLSRNIFQKNFQNFFQAKFQKKDAMLLVTDFATVSKGLIIVKYHLHHKVLFNLR